MSAQLLCATYHDKIKERNNDYAKMAYDTLEEALFNARSTVEGAAILAVMRDRERTLSADFLACLSDNQNAFVKAHTHNPVTAIPDGIYCYKITGMEEDKNKGATLKTASCPHLSRSDKLGCRCDFMGLSDEDMDGGLLWDGVKKCGLKLISKEDMPYLSDMSH